MIIWQPPPIEATGPRSPPLDGTMRAPNLDIPTPRSAWSGLSVYLIPKPRILIYNGFGTHETLEILEYCFENNIILCRLPSHTSYKLQPCDIGVFGPLKAAYRDQVERLDRGGANTVGKEHFTSMYSTARERALTSRNIKAGWAASGLFPFNPDRGLRDTSKPVTALTVLKAYGGGGWSMSVRRSTPDASDIRGSYVAA
jgi:hypothetical protein